MTGQNEQSLKLADDWYGTDILCISKADPTLYGSMKNLLEPLDLSTAQKVLQR